MSESTSREEFVRDLSESGVFQTDELREIIEGLNGSNPGNPDGAALASHLVHSNHLTQFQADAILRRRFGELCIGNYVVIDRLGAGGMGTVFKARHRRMKRVVALKLLARESAGKGNFAQRFQREVETISQLSHPNIVMAFDADETESGLFLVMEFVNGRDLGSEVEQRGPFSVADAVDCVLQAARGLAYAHAQGIVHRDVKPANLLRDASGLVKVADLGLARLNTPETTGYNSGLTQAGGVLGTVDFMAPEQALDSTTVDQRVDIYSLGCTFYYLLTGRALYAAGSLMGLLLKHRDAPIPALCDARPEVPAELDALFRRMVAKSPEDRYATTDELIQALEQAQKQPLSHAKPIARQSPGALHSRHSDVTVVDASLQSLDSLGSSKTLLSSLTSIAGEPPTPSDIRRVIDLTVVLVEPSRAQVSIVRKYLQQLGIEKVYSTGSGRQALELAKQEQADVLLCAMHLADMTGLQLAHNLHADSACSNAGFVLASSESDSFESGSLFESSRIVLLPKPYDLRRLAHSLAQATGRTPEELMASLRS